MSAMDALALIKEDHKRLKRLLKETLEAEGPDREPRMEHLRTEMKNTTSPTSSWMSCSMSRRKPICGRRR